MAVLIATAPASPSRAMQIAIEVCLKTFIVNECLREHERDTSISWLAALPSRVPDADNKDAVTPPKKPNAPQSHIHLAGADAVIVTKICIENASLRARLRNASSLSAGATSRKRGNPILRTLHISQEMRTKR